MPSHQRTWWSLILLGLLASMLTCVSSVYQQPLRCAARCSAPDHEPCPRGTCRPGEPRAGFPFPMFRDHARGSPLHAAGRLDQFEYVQPFLPAVLGNILVYSVLLVMLWELWQMWAERSTPGNQHQSEDHGSEM